MTESTVAAVQFAPELLRPRENLQKALQMAFEASVGGAGVVVLPELCISGQQLTSRDEAAVCAQECDGWQSQEFWRIAKYFNNRIVFGYVEAREGKFYNSAAVIGPLGLEANVQKHNLYGSDLLWATPSYAEFPVVVTSVGRLGVLICRDVMNKYRESVANNTGYKFYSRGSVDTIALLTNWGTSYGYPDSAWVELVEETGSNVIVSNRIGEESGTTFKGGSCIITRDRKIWTDGSSFDYDAIVGGIVK